MPLLANQNALNTLGGPVPVNHARRVSFSIHWATGVTGGVVTLYASSTQAFPTNPQVLQVWAWAAGDADDTITFNESFEFVWAKITTAITGGGAPGVQVEVQAYE